MKQVAILLAMATVILTVSACATGRWESEELVDRRHIRVTLEHRVENDQIVDQNYNQPRDIEPNVVETLLKNLFYMTAPEFFGEAEEQPVFQIEELERLAPALSTALQKANENQRVRFTSHNRGGGLIFKDNRKTSGALFVDPDDRLNIAFSYINRITDYEDRIDSYGSTDPDPLTIESSDAPVIAKAPFIEHHLTTSGAPSPMWLKADLDAVRAAVKTPPVPAPEPARTPEPEPQEVEPQEVEPARKAPSDGQAPAPGDWENQKETLKTKLEYLKELYDDGLISETEYEAKKQDLLNQIR